MTAKDIKSADGGYSSRKLAYAAFTSAAIFACGCLAAFWAGFRPCLETTDYSLCAVLGMYLGGNVTAKWAIGKTITSSPTPPDDDQK